MRLYGMIGDTAPVEAEETSWRPPEWKAERKSCGATKTNAQIRKPRIQGFSRRVGIPPEATGYNTLDGTKITAHCIPHDVACNHFDVEKGDAVEILNIETTAAIKPQARQRMQVRDRRQAQIVCTSTRHLRFWHRILALAVSLSVAISLLGIITTLISAKLDSIESQLGGRVSERLYPGAPLHALSQSTAMDHRRRLLESRSSTQISKHEQNNALANEFEDRFSFFRPGSVVGTFLSLYRVVKLFLNENGQNPRHSFHMIGAALSSIGEATRPNSNSNPYQAYRHIVPSVQVRDLGVPNHVTSNTVGQTAARSSPVELQAQRDHIMLAHGNEAAPYSGRQNSPATSPVPPATGNTAHRHATHKPETVDGRANSAYHGSRLDHFKGLVDQNYLAAYMRNQQNVTGIQQAVTSLHEIRIWNSSSAREPAYVPIQTGIHTQLSHENMNESRNNSKMKSLSFSSGANIVPQKGEETAKRAAEEKFFVHESSRDISTKGSLIYSSATNLHQMSGIHEVIEMWNISSNNKYICRFHHICRLENGQILLPKWMASKADTVALCGLRNVHYLIDTQASSAFAIRDERKVSPAGFTLNLSFSDRDLFGDSPPRDHMPHFVSDILRTLASLEVLGGPMTKQYYATRITPLSKTSTVFRSPLFPEFLKPLLLLFDCTLNRAPADWVPNVAKLFATTGFAFAPSRREMAAESTARPKPAPGKCFKSIITNNLNQYEPFGLFDAHGQNVFYTANNISREHISSGAKLYNGLCAITVTALTRPGPRALLNLAELKTNIDLMATQLGMQATFRVVSFDNQTPFQEQVNIMQTTNVLISSHGAGNTNFIFMKPGAAVIEVFPFSYRAGPFNLFAHIFGLDYRHAMSAPQTDVFKECMKRHETSPDIKAYVFSLWDEAVILDRQNPGLHRLKFETEFGKPGKSEGMTTRSCARMQELLFDVKHVASMAVDAGRMQCQQALVS